MMRPSILRYAASLVLLVGLGGACGERSMSTSAAHETPATSLLSPLFGDSSTPALIECVAPDSTATATALIGPLGGVLSAGGVSVIIPQNAIVGDAVSFTLSVPSSKYVELEVGPDGGGHYLFALPVTVSIDYGRCGSTYDATTLSAWNIDPATKALLERMIGVDNKLTHTLTFVTPHFSGYAVAD